MFKRFVAGCAVALLSLLGSTSASSTVLYNNFGPGDSFIDGLGYTIGFGTAQGVGFVAGDTGLVTSIDVGMGLFFNGAPPQSVDFNLYSDSGSNNIGALLESFSVTVSNDFGTVATSTGVLSGTTLLSAGQNYWLIASAPAVTNVPWNINSVGDTGSRWVNGVVSADLLATFRVNASSVPEPGTFILVGLGLAGLAASRRRTR